MAMIHCAPSFENCILVGKKMSFWTGNFEFSCWLAGAVFIERRFSERTKAILDVTIKKLKTESGSIWFFAEGQRRNTGTIHPFKRGAFHMAINGKVPIVPVVISQYTFLDHKKKLFDKANVVIEVLPPVRTDNLTTENVEEMAETVRNTMLTAFYKLKSDS